MAAATARPARARPEPLPAKDHNQAVTVLLTEVAVSAAIHVSGIGTPLGTAVRHR